MTLDVMAFATPQRTATACKMMFFAPAAAWVELAALVRILVEGRWRGRLSSACSSSAR